MTEFFQNVKELRDEIDGIDSLVAKVKCTYSEILADPNPSPRTCSTYFHEPY